MEIRFTKEQYENLVKIVYLGTWMINAFRTDNCIKKFDELEQYIDDYNNDNFGEELIYRLARRDLLKKYGENKITKMRWEERLEKETPFIEKYEEEFEKYRIERIEIQD